MKKLTSYVALCAAIFMGSCATEPSSIVERSFDFISGQLPVAFESIENTRAELIANDKLKSGLYEQVIPRNIEADGSLHLVGARDWTCGFFPGLLWYTYEYTQDEKWAEQASAYQALIEDAKYRTNTHDLGFIIYCSFGNGYRLTGNEAFKDVILTASDSLITRYKPNVGLIRSWDHNADKWGYPVIIDNMMNLEMLCEASKLSGDPKYKDIAISHADKTMQNHFREDYSCYHVVDYDAQGNAVNHQTHQGYSHDSAWARGQGWALYGYTMMYRQTGFERYLEHANHVAEYILGHERLPSDKVPYWDFDAPNIPNEPRDVSAGAIISSALYELSTYTPEKSEEYVAVADQILETIEEKFLAEKGGDYGFVTLESVGSMPGGFEIAVPINYADYYFAEALLRKDKLEKEGKLF